jgi:hypothetical protein
MSAFRRAATSHAGLWVLAINAIALIAFVGSPVAPQYPLAVLGILAFSMVQALLPACRIRMDTPVCPANIAQGYYWVQLVLITVLVGYFGFSLGTLPSLPSKRAIDLAIVANVVGYLAFSVAYQCLARPIARRALGRVWAARAAYFIVPFALVGLLGLFLTHGSVASFIEYASSPIEQRLRSEDATTLGSAAGNFLKHFLGFAVVLAWSSWLSAAPRRPIVIVRVTAGLVLLLLIANFHYNRGTILGPLLGLAAAFSAHVWRIPFKAVIVAGALVLSVAYSFGAYRSSDLNVTELSRSAVEEGWSVEGIVEFVQIYASGPQMTAYVIDSLEGTLYYGRTLLPSLVYPIPVLGKPFRDASGTVVFNAWIYGDTESFDQILPLNGELYMNFHLVGVILGNVLLGWALAWLQRKFMAAPVPVESYAWLLMALWTMYPGSLLVTSQIYIYSFWPIYGYFLAKRFWSRTAATSLSASTRPQSIPERRVA